MQDDRNIQDDTAAAQGFDNMMPAKITVSGIIGLILGLVGIVLGILGLPLALIPLLNFGAWIIVIIGAIGLIFCIVSLVATFRRHRRGKVIAVIATIICVIEIAVVIAMTFVYTDVAEEAVESDEAVPTGVVESEGTVTEQSGYDSLAVGTVVELDNGLRVCVDSYQHGTADGDSPVMRVGVTYENTSDTAISYNLFDWSAETEDGKEAATLIDYTGMEDVLSGGVVDVGETVTGNVYFEGTPVKAIYSSDLGIDDTAEWILP